MDNKDIAIKTASAALTIGVGLFTGQHFLETEPILSAVFMNVVAGIGSGQVSEIWDSGLRRAGNMWSADDAVLNHDLVLALGEAMQQAFTIERRKQLLRDMRSRPRFTTTMSRDERAQAETNVKAWLKGMHDFFADRDNDLHTEIIAEQNDFRTLTDKENLPTIVLRRMRERLMSYFQNQFVTDFLIERFNPEQVAPNFIAILKKSRKEGSAAWTAYEMLVFKNLQTGLIVNRTIIEKHVAQSEIQHAKTQALINQVHSHLAELDLERLHEEHAKFQSSIEQTKLYIEGLHQQLGIKVPNEHRKLNNVGSLFGRTQSLQQIDLYFDSISQREHYLFITGMPGCGRRALAHYFLQNTSKLSHLHLEIVQFADEVSFEAELSRLGCQTESGLIEWIARAKILLLIEIADGFSNTSPELVDRVTRILSSVNPSVDNGRIIVVGEPGWDENVPAFKVELGLLSTEDSVEMLYHIAQLDREAVLLNARQQYDLRYIAQITGGHAASIELVANLIRSSTVAAVRKELETQLRFGPEVSTTSLHSEMVVRAIKQLDLSAATTLFLLSLYPQDYSVSNHEVNRAKRLVPDLTVTTFTVLRSLRQSGLLQEYGATYRVHPVVRRLIFERWKEQQLTSLTPVVVKTQYYQIGRILRKDKRWLEALLYFYRAERWLEVWRLFQAHYPHASNFPYLQAGSTDAIVPLRAGYITAYVWQSVGMTRVAQEQANQILARAQLLEPSINRDALLLLLYSILIVTTDRLKDEEISAELEAEDALMLLEELDDGTRRSLRSEEVQLRIALGRIIDPAKRTTFAEQTVKLSADERTVNPINNLLRAKAKSSLAYALAHVGDFERGVAVSKQVLEIVKVLPNTKETQEMVASELAMQLLFLHMLGRSEEAVQLIEAENGEMFVRNYGGSSDVYLGFLINLATAEIGARKLDSAESRLLKARTLCFRLKIPHGDEIDLRLAEIALMRGDRVTANATVERLEKKRDELGWLADELDKLVRRLRNGDAIDGI